MRGIIRNIIVTACQLELRIRRSLFPAECSGRKELQCIIRTNERKEHSVRVSLVLYKRVTRDCHYFHNKHFNSHNGEKWKPLVELQWVVVLLILFAPGKGWWSNAIKCSFPILLWPGMLNWSSLCPSAELLPNAPSLLKYFSRLSRSWTSKFRKNWEDLE